MKEWEIADELFKIWDKKLRRYIMFEEFANNLINLGLAPDQTVVRKIMLALKGARANFPDQINLKEFRRLFELNRFGNKAVERINKEFCDSNKNFAMKQFFNIIMNQQGTKNDKVQQKSMRKT